MVSQEQRLASMLKPVTQWSRWVQTPEGRRFFAFFAVALLVRLVLAMYHGFWHDTQVFVEWGRAFRHAPITFYSVMSTANYPPLINYVLAVLVAIYSIVMTLFGAHPIDYSVMTSPLLAVIIKIPGIAGDMGVVAALYILASKRLSERRALIVAAAFAFSPPILLTSVGWGQFDTLAAFFALLALIMALRNQPVWSGVWMACGVLIKPQPIVFAPLILVYLWRWEGLRSAARYIAGATGAVIVCCLPYLIPPHVQVIAAYHNLQQILDHRATDSAFNLWWLGSYPTNSLNPTLDGGHAVLGPLSPNILGALLFGGCFLAVCAGIWVDGRAQTLYLGAGIVGVAFFVLTTQQHERYIIQALTMLAVAAIYSMRSVFWYVVVSVLSTAQLVFALIIRYPSSNVGLNLAPARAWLADGHHWLILILLAIVFVLTLVGVLLTYPREIKPMQ